MSEETKSSRRDFLKVAGSFAAGAVVAGAGVAATRPSGVTQTATATVTQTATGPAKRLWAGNQEKVWIPVLNRLMSFDDVVAEIEKEKKVIVANWTYWGLIDTFWGPVLKKYVKDIYGVDIEVEWTGTQTAKGGFMGALDSALAAGQP